MADRTQPVFMFYSGSLDSYPGMGKCEYIHPLDLPRYEKLNEIQDWRKMFSNFYCSPFHLDGYTWLSVEHYFHANKAPIDSGTYKNFTIESMSTISREFGVAIKRAGRRIPMTQEQLLEWDNGKSVEIIDKGRRAKFEQNPALKEMLLLTRGALLTHRATPRSRVVIELGLMELRDVM